MRRASENHIEHTATFPEEETAQAPGQTSLYPTGKVLALLKNANVASEQDEALVLVVPKTP